MLFSLLCMVLRVPEINRRDLLGGLIHEYYRVAA
jgi:hypothetical protein